MTNQKIVLITGTSTGVGMAIALMVAEKAGYKVYATMRNLDKANTLKELAIAKGLQLQIMQLDVQDSGSINTCISEIISKEGRLDVLINNAGSGYIRSAEQAPESDVQKIFDINFFGTIKCIKAVLPIMREQKSGHIICISSVGGLVGQPMNEIYCASKFAMEGLCESMSTYLKPYFNIDISLIEPAGIKTEFVNNVMKQVAGSGGILQDAYAPILQDYMGSRTGRADTSQTPEEVASVILNCMEMDIPPLRMRTSAAAEAFCNLKTSSDPDGLIQQKMIQKLLLGK